MAEPNDLSFSVTLKRAEEWSDALADIVCWCRGFAAGRDDNHNSPISTSVDSLSDLNARLKDEIRKAKL